MSTRKTCYMMAFYNSIVFNPDPKIKFDLCWIAEQELLPIIDREPAIIRFMSPEMQDLIIQYHTERFVSASLTSVKITGWFLAQTESLTVKLPRGFI